MQNKIFQVVSARDKSQKEIELHMTDTCPLCGMGIDMSRSVICVYHDEAEEKMDFFVYCTHICPSCHRIFISKHHLYKNPMSLLGFSGDFYDNEQFLFPCAHSFVEIPPRIVSDFPHFVNVYKEAQCAKAYGLKNIYGMALRKATECLVKEYATKQNPNDKDTIAEKKLGGCIKQYINSEEIRALADASRLIGNNESHWKNTNTNDDICLLENCIIALMQYINQEAIVQGARNYIDSHP